MHTNEVCVNLPRLNAVCVALPGGLRNLPASRKTAEKSRGHRRRKPSSEPVQQNEEDTLMLLMAMAAPETWFKSTVRQYYRIERSGSICWQYIKVEAVIPIL